MKVVIAGCGWLGQALGQALMRDGHTVVGIRRDFSATARLARHGIEPLILDLCDPRAAEALPTDADAIVACQSAGAATETAYRRAYLTAMHPLIDFCGRRGGRRLIYTGSTGVFGQTDGEIVDETTAVAPSGATAGILVRAERQILDAAARGTQACLVRLSGLYGPGRYAVVERVRQGRLALGPGDETWMNWCHREDAVRALAAALLRGQRGAVYHASDAHPARRRDVVRWIAGQLGLEPPGVSGTVAGGNRRGANRRVTADRSRAELQIDLAFPSFRDGLVGNLAADL